jgi:hypothetical protein
MKRVFGRYNVFPLFSVIWSSNNAVCFEGCGDALTNGCSNLLDRVIRHVASRVNAWNASSLKNVAFDVSFIVNFDAGISGDLAVGCLSDLDENSVNRQFPRFPCLFVKHDDLGDKLLAFDFSDFSVQENLHILFGSYVFHKGFFSAKSVSAMSHRYLGGNA